MPGFTEKDWKYLRSIHDEMLSSLCQRINQKAVEIARAQGESEHAKYLKLFKYIHDADDIIAQCFNDWRRSTIDQRALSLRHHNLLTHDHLENLTPDAQACVKMWESLTR